MANPNKDWQRVVASHLERLRSLHNLRELLAGLNYQVGDEPISIDGDWKTELAQTARQGGLQVIARHDDFVITHCHLPNLRIGPQREMVTKLIRKYDRGLFVFSDLEESNWHLVNVKRDSQRHSRMILRRISIGPQEQLRTAIERISLLRVESPSWSGLDVELRHEEAFDVEKVTQQFYRDYKDIFDHIVERLESHASYRTSRAFAQHFMNRMMFLYFLQRKGWLDGRGDFIPWLWRRYQEDPARDGDFYNRYLVPLFFEAFNSPVDDRTGKLNKRNMPDDVKETFLRLPFLNGGLFYKAEGIDDQGLGILDSEFENLFENLLQRYNFTVSEDTPLDVEVAVNPEMLGKVYENLVLEEERSQAGIFYTPKVEIDFMCRRTLIEYLDEKPIVDRADLIRLVMNVDVPELIPQLPPERLREIRRRLEEVRVVDPACGSGAFLVGMMQVISGLLRVICEQLGEPYHDFEVKKRIIGENLFGVDIKDWAVRVAELRLWLSLIIHASLDDVQRDPRKPILPNLTFRIQVGDSLVEEIEGRSLSPRGRYAQMADDVGRQVNQLVNHKMDYFYNRGEVMPSSEIRELETKVFQAILDDELQQIDYELKRLRAIEQKGSQQELGMARAVGAVRPGSQKGQLRQNIERLERERSRIVAIRNSQDIRRGKGPFLWDIEFAEVFQEKGGFDIVIGNPPYVRQEEIAPLHKDPQNFSHNQWEAEKRKYKEALQRSIQTHWGPSAQLSKRADYYMYFYLHGLALLRERGCFCFITSNSWLDVGYGADLQRFLLTNVEIKDIYDNHAKRSFSGSDINTVIVLFRRPPEGADLSRHTARFVAFKKPFEDVLTSENLASLERADSLQMTSDFRVYPVAQDELWQAGLDAEEGSGKAMDLGFGYGQYRGDKWGGKYLRAPDIFFTILEKGKDKLVKLGDIAEVRRGFTTGANDFFYLEPDPSVARVADVVELAKENPSFLIPVRNSAGWEGEIEAEFLKPVIKSPREIKTVKIRLEDLRYLIFMCHLSKAELKKQGKTNALEYIKWGELQDYDERPTCASRERWWDLGKWSLAQLLWVETMFEAFRIYQNSPNTHETDKFYGILLSVDETGLICGILNSTLVLLWKLMSGFHSLGQGGLKSAVYEVKEFQLFHPSTLTPSQRERLEKAFNEMAKREIKSIFEELGLPKPNRDYSNIYPEDVSLDKVFPDRRELDQVIFEVLGLTENERLQVYRAVVELVKDRLVKARSV